MAIIIINWYVRTRTLWFNGTAMILFTLLYWYTHTNTRAHMWCTYTHICMHYTHNETYVILWLAMIAAQSCGTFSVHSPYEWVRTNAKQAFDSEQKAKNAVLHHKNVSVHLFYWSTDRIFYWANIYCLLNVSYNLNVYANVYTISAGLSSIQMKLEWLIVNS